MKALRVILIVFVLAALVVACGPKPGKIDLTPKKINLKAADGTKKIASNVFDSENKKMAAHKPIVWTSSDAAVATVGPEGEVKAVASGEATITATLGDVTATVPVSVKIVGSITLTPAALTMKVGESQTLTAAVLDEKGKEIAGENVKWAVVDKTIAKVIKGKVTGDKAGQTKVTAQVGTVTAEAALTVEEAPKPEPTPVVKGKGDKGKTPAAKVVPTTATKKVPPAPKKK